MRIRGRDKLQALKWTSGSRALVQTVECCSDGAQASGFASAASERPVTSGAPSRASSPHRRPSIQAAVVTAAESGTQSDDSCCRAQWAADASEAGSESAAAQPEAEGLHWRTQYLRATQHGRDLQIRLEAAAAQDALLQSALEHAVTTIRWFCALD